MLRGSNFCPLRCPGYYEPILHSIGLVSTVFNVFGIFLTLSKSRRTSNYRFCQFYVQMTSLLTEFDLSILNPAYFFFPMIGGINCGVLREYQVKFGITSHVCITVFAFIICLQVPALLSCFLYRHQAAARCSPDKSWNLSKCNIVCTLVIYHTFPFLIAFSLYHSGLSIEEKRISLEQNYPDCLESLNDFTFDTYDYKLNSTFVAFGILISMYYVMAGAVGFGLSWRTGQILHRYRYIMSARTYQLHKSSLVTLTAQVTGPTLVLGIPVFVVYVVVASQMAKLHVLAATAPFFISMHSMVSTVCIIMATPTYRTVCWKYVESVQKTFVPRSWTRKKGGQPGNVTVMASPIVGHHRPPVSCVNTFF